jgi:hypothetical protein
VILLVLYELDILDPVKINVGWVELKLFFVGKLLGLSEKKLLLFVIAQLVL